MTTYYDLLKKGYVPLALSMFMLLLGGCQVGGVVDQEDQNATSSSAKPMVTPDVTMPTLISDEAYSYEQPSSTPSPELITPTIGVTVRIVPTMSATPALSDAQNEFDFHPVIAFVGQTSDAPYSDIALYDSKTRQLSVIATSSNRALIGGPLWSPQRELLAFVQDEGVVTYSPSTKELQVFNLIPPDPQSGADSEVELILSGWSYNSDWLAYQYRYDTLPGESYLLNLKTGESQVPGFTETLWIEWSDTTSQIASFDDQFVYVSTIANPAEVTQFQKEGQQPNRIAWHADGNALLVASLKQLVIEMFSHLWYLDIDTGEWTYIGKYPSINDMAFSPDSSQIAISSTDYISTNSQLTIIDADTFETMAQIKLPSESMFYGDIEWLNSDVVVLNTSQNLYVLPVNEPGQAFWALGPNDTPLWDTYSSIVVTDW